MKKILKKAVLCLAVLSVISCKNNGYKFIETVLTNDYNIELPEYLVKEESGVWSYKNDTYNTMLKIDVANGTSAKINTDIDKEIEIVSKLNDNSEIYKEKYFVKSEIIDKNGFKGKISFFEKKNTGKRLGLVSLQTYIVIGVIEDDSNRIYFNSYSFNKNINDDLLKSIKSISKNNIVSNTNSFNEEEAKKDGYQVFIDDNFMIKCSGNLLFDKLRFEDGQQNGQTNYSRPYHVFINGVDYNINVSDMTNLFNGKDKAEINNFNKKDLQYYQTKFDEMGIKNEQKTFKEFDAVFYETTQGGKLTKAVYFHKDMKSYMLQVTSKSGTDKLFKEFINSFEIINKI
ncbi:hypothetical protein [Flavobacterium psychraquaticum]|uniref:hypothetical protein n=1 Tax=Flavobacterium psychraquaticum TaxID=3103958 RepID=UPI002ACDBD6A|nr:hypothetical protein [Flavobacterium sp. LB-N7T]